jgi:uncharacterized iron-regulated membrane protein
MRPRLIAIAFGVILAMAGCSAETEAPAAEEPASVEEIAGSELSRITLSARAAERLGIETANVEEQGGRLALPYTALLYDAEGRTWAYTSPETNVFVRHDVVVDQIQGDVAFLFLGPPAGTAVVTTGAAELFGTETGVGGGH